MREATSTPFEGAVLNDQPIPYSPEERLSLSQDFRRYGFVKVSGIVSVETKDAVKQEVLRLLDNFSERRDLTLATTDYTPRRMSVVRSENIAEHGSLITSIYQDDAVVNCLADIARERLHPCPSADEEFLITRHEKKGDTHGWHWGDFTFALIWVLETPPIEFGGMLQCVPHTDWDKSNPRIHEYLCRHQITTYPFVSGDIYFLKTDTTLHRTIPLNRDATRIILNMTFASEKDLAWQTGQADRWWTDKPADAAVPEGVETKQLDEFVD